MMAQIVGVGDQMPALWRCVKMGQEVMSGVKKLRSINSYVGRGISIGAKNMKQSCLRCDKMRSKYVAALHHSLVTAMKLLISNR